MNHTHALALLHLISEELQTAQVERSFLRMVVEQCREGLEKGHSITIEELEDLFAMIDTALEWTRYDSNNS